MYDSRSAPTINATIIQVCTWVQGSRSARTSIDDVAIETPLYSRQSVPTPKCIRLLPRFLLLKDERFGEKFTWASADAPWPPKSGLGTPCVIAMHLSLSERARCGRRGGADVPRRRLNTCDAPGDASLLDLAWAALASRPGGRASGTGDPIRGRSINDLGGAVLPKRVIRLAVEDNPRFR